RLFWLLLLLLFQRLSCWYWPLPHQAALAGAATAAKASPANTTLAASPVCFLLVMMDLLALRRGLRRAEASELGVQVASREASSAARDQTLWSEAKAALADLEAQLGQRRAHPLAAVHR